MLHSTIHYSGNSILRMGLGALDICPTVSSTSFWVSPNVLLSFCLISSATPFWNLVAIKSSASSEADPGPNCFPWTPSQYQLPSSHTFVGILDHLPSTVSTKPPSCFLRKPPCEAKPRDIAHYCKMCSGSEFQDGSTECARMDLLALLENIFC